MQTKSHRLVQVAGVTFNDNISRCFPYRRLVQQATVETRGREDLLWIRIFVTCFSGLPLVSAAALAALTVERQLHVIPDVLWGSLGTGSVQSGLRGPTAQ